MTQDNPMSDATRKAFEESFLAQKNSNIKMLDKNSVGEYLNQMVESAWLGFKAGRTITEAEFRLVQTAIFDAMDENPYSYVDEAKKLVKTVFAVLGITVRSGE